MFLSMYIFIQLKGTDLSQGSLEGSDIQHQLKIDEDWRVVTTLVFYISPLQLSSFFFDWNDVRWVFPKIGGKPPKWMVYKLYKGKNLFFNG